MRKIINKIREIIPLSLRIKTGPFIAYIVYFFNVYIRKARIPHILSIEETADMIKKNNLSAIRFGDGEMSIMDGISIPFQDYSEDLAKKLKFILQRNHDGLLICIPNFFGKMSIYVKEGFLFNIHHMFKHGYLWRKLLSPTQIYGNTFVSRPYIYLKDKSHSENTFKKLKSIWADKEVVIIEGEKSKNGIGNDLFDNMKSLERIPCPNENAYLKYNEIKNRVLKISKDKLILIALGPTTKILAYDLFLLGYRVIDIGHLDLEYEMLRRGEKNAHQMRLVHIDIKAKY